MFPLILSLHSNPHNRPNLCFEFWNSCPSLRERSHSVLSHWRPCRSPQGARRGGSAPNARICCRRPVTSRLSRALPTAPRFYHPLAGGNKNTLGGSGGTLRVLAKPASNLPSPHQLKVTSVRQTWRWRRCREKRRGGERGTERSSKATTRAPGGAGAPPSRPPPAPEQGKIICSWTISARRSRRENLFCHPRKVTH